jgi:hypothetical protein
MATNNKGCLPSAVLATGIITFVALLLTVVLGCVFPASMRLTSPIACPAGTAESVVVTTVSHPAPGQTLMSADLVCIGPQGQPERPGFLRTWGTGFVACWIVSWLLIMAPWIGHRIAYGRPAGNA